MEKEPDIQKELDYWLGKEDEVIIGKKHPMMYAYRILCFILRYGDCKVMVPKQGSIEYTLRPPKVAQDTLVSKPMEEQWGEIMRFLSYARVKYIENGQTLTHKKIVAVR